MYLDLSNNQKIKLNPNHNCQGAKQPGYLHIGSNTPIQHRGVVRQPGPGHGRVVRYSQSQGGWLLEVEGVSMLLGGWWLETAARGLVEFVPVINMEPQMVEVTH